MIEELELKNFRSHENTKLEFHPGVNVIVGLPDKGKSHLFRAIRWVMENRPIGKGVRSRFTDKRTRVTIKVDGKRVSLILGKKKRYELEVGGVVKKYQAVRQSVPDVITETLNISEVSFQKQLDKPFLITEGGAEVSRVFNRITRLEKVDGWIKKLNSRLLKKGREKATLESEQRQKVEQLEGMKGLSRLKRDADFLDEIYRKWQSVASQVDALEELISGIEKGKRVIKSYRDTGPLLVECSRLVGEYQEVAQIQGQIERLDSLIPAIRDCVAAVNGLDKQIVEGLSKYRATLLKEKKCPFCSFCTTPVRKHNVEKLLEAV